MRIVSTPTASIVPGSVLNVQTTGSSSFQIFGPKSSGAMSTAIETYLQLLANGNAYGASITGTAGAGNKAVAELRNPAASGKVVYVYSIDIFVPVAMAVTIVLDGTTITPVTVPPNMQAGGAAGVALVGGNNQLTPTGSLIYTAPTLTANADYQVPQPWVISLPATHNLQIIGQTVNQAFTCNLRWVETPN